VKDLRRRLDAQEALEAVDDALADALHGLHRPSDHALHAVDQAGDEVLAELEHPRRQAGQELPGAVPPVPEGGGDLDTPVEDTARDAAQEAVEAVPPLAGEVLEALERVRPPAAEQGF